MERTIPYSDAIQILILSKNISFTFTGIRMDNTAPCVYIFSKELV